MNCNKYGEEKKSFTVEIYKKSGKNPYSNGNWS
jgi:hypothetical protein